MKELFDWLRKNFVTLLLIAIIIWGVRAIIGANQTGYKDEIKAANNFITILKGQYDSLDNRETVALELLSASRSNVTSLEDSLAKSIIDNITQRKRHEKEVEKFELITTAEHYLDYIQWIDTVSFE